MTTVLCETCITTVNSLYCEHELGKAIILVGYGISVNSISLTRKFAAISILFCVEEWMRAYGCKSRKHNSQKNEGEALSSRAMVAATELQGGDAEF